VTSAYQKYTVANLKEELRERGLPISGNKSVLIERLIHDDNEQNQEEEKIEFECASCESILRISATHKGKVKCPSCGEVQQINASKKITNLQKLPNLENLNPFNNLSNRNQQATIISGIGILLLIASGFTFLQSQNIGYEGNEHTLDVPYDELETTTWNCEDGTQVMLLDVNNGVIDCPDGSDEWSEKMLAMIFLSCCILLPLSVIMGLIGLFTGQLYDSSNIVNALTNTEGEVVSNVSESVRNDSRLAKMIRIGGITISSSVVAIIGIAILIICILFIYAIWLLLTDPTPNPW
tara:strand:- start:1941 stop:2822 length:882 start_codon:yes stop_codon:yes gene_type:complete